MLLEKALLGDGCGVSFARFTRVATAPILADRTPIGLPSLVHFRLFSLDHMVCLLVALQELFLLQLGVNNLIQIIDTTLFSFRQRLLRMILKAKLLLEILYRVVDHLWLFQEFVFASISYLFYNLHVLFLLNLFLEL